MSGLFKIDAWLQLGTGFVEHSKEIYSFEMVSVDYYGTGFMPVGHKHGDVVIDQKWRIE